MDKIKPPGYLVENAALGRFRADSRKLTASSTDVTRSEGTYTVLLRDPTASLCSAPLDRPEVSSVAILGYN